MPSREPLGADGRFSKKVVRGYSTRLLNALGKVDIIHLLCLAERGKVFGRRGADLAARMPKSHV